MNRTRIFALIFIIILISIGWFNYASTKAESGFLARFPFRLGLDLSGGTELVYRADTSTISSGTVEEGMDALRDVIERRVNLFGVSEPIVQVEEASVLGGRRENKLVVALPGVTDIEEAVRLIGATPTLEFQLLRQDAESLVANATSTPSADLFLTTGLTGRLLQKAALEFAPNSNELIVSITFNDEGRDLFAQITREHTGRFLGIFLDGEPISIPVIREEISDGKAQISGSFTPTEAKTLVRNLNYGALPVPIELVGTNSIGASLGTHALRAGIKAGVIGFILVALFLILWYRLPGLIATCSLVLYIALSLAIFKLIPVTLTAAGLAGFILSIGMAVDANILIFERMKEELRKGRGLDLAMHEGFRRAWLSIRDSNISSIITAVILFWLGTSEVKGFEMTLGLGVLISMFTAITASRVFLYSLPHDHAGPRLKFLFGSGFRSRPLL